MFLTPKLLTGLLTTLTLGTTLSSNAGQPYHGEPIQEKQHFDAADGFITNTVVDQRDNVWVATTKGIMLKQSGTKTFSQWTPAGITFGDIKGDVKIIKAVDSSKVYIFMTMNGITKTYPNAGQTIWVTDANDPSKVSTLDINGSIKNISSVYANNSHVLIGGQTPANETILFEYNLQNKSILKYGDFPVFAADDRIDAIYQGNGNWFSDRVVILVSGIVGGAVEVRDDKLAVSAGAITARTMEYSENADKTIFPKELQYTNNNFNFYDSINVINVDGKDRIIATGGTYGYGKSSSAFMELDYSGAPSDRTKLSFWKMCENMYDSYAKSFVFTGNSIWSFVSKPFNVNGIADRSLVFDWTDKTVSPDGTVNERNNDPYTSYKSRTEIDLPEVVNPLMDKIPASLQRLLLPNFASDSHDNIFFGVYDTMFMVGEEPIILPSDNNSGNFELSAGAIAGIVIGSVVVGVGFGIGGYYGFKKFDKFAKKFY